MIDKYIGDNPMNIDEYIKNNYLVKSDSEMGNKLGITKDKVRYRRNKLKLKRNSTDTMSIEGQLERDIKLISLKEDKKGTDRKYKVLLERIKSAEKERDAALNITSKIDTFKIKQSLNDSESEATAFIIASDWHIEEEVKSNTINGLNKYNLDIASKRGERFFINGMSLIKMLQKDVKINTVVLALLGDFISGNIHEELLETCQLQPIEAAIYVQNIIASGIEYMLKDKTLNEIIIPCHSGNHGRITKNKHISTAEGNSIENFMYHSLSNYFKNEKRVKFIIAEGYHSYIDVYEYTIRLHHGDSMRYGGGVGGPTIPINKAIAQWDKIKQADLDVFGHFHQFMDGGKFIMNGSMIGYNAYALSIKASFEPPKQALFLIDKKRFKTITAPILFD